MKPQRWLQPHQAGRAGQPDAPCGVNQAPFQRRVGSRRNVPIKTRVPRLKMLWPQNRQHVDFTVVIARSSNGMVPVTF